MTDTIATHNLVTEVEAKRLGLILEKDASCIKAVNSKESPITGVAKGLDIAIDPWRGKPISLLGHSTTSE